MADTLPPRIPYPWERQDDEPETAWHCFTAYRDDPGRPRSQARVVSQTGHGRAIVQRWSSVHRWRERVAAWDSEQDRVTREAEVAERQKAGKRHAQIAMTALDVAIRPSLTLLRRLNEDPTALDSMSLAALYDLAVKSAKLIPSLVAVERLARGETTQSIVIREQSTEDDEAARNVEAEWLGGVYAALAEAGLMTDAPSGNGDHPSDE